MLRKALPFCLMAFLLAACGTTRTVTVRAQTQTVTVHAAALVAPKPAAPEGPGFIGAEVESMNTQATADGAVLGSIASSEKEEGCSVPPEEGVLIVGIDPHGPAAMAGLHGGRRMLGGYEVGGDIITSLDESAVRDTDVLTALLAQHKPGETVRLDVLHCNGAPELVEVTLESRSAAEAEQRAAER